jgi:hypothetical protein
MIMNFDSRTPLPPSGHLLPMSGEKGKRKKFVKRIHVGRIKS